MDSEDARSEFSEDLRPHLPSPQPPRPNLTMTPSPTPRAEPRVRWRPVATSVIPRPETPRAPAAPVLTASQPPQGQLQPDGDFVFQDHQGSPTWQPPPEPLPAPLPSDLQVQLHTLSG